MSLVKQHFYGFYNLVNIYSYFIRMVELKYWGNNLDGFQSHVAHTRRPGRAWRDARFPFFFFFLRWLYCTSVLPFPCGPSLLSSSGQAPYLRRNGVSSLRPSTKLGAEITQNWWGTGTCKSLWFLVRLTS